MAEWSLVTGLLPAVLTGVGLLALLGLVVLPPRPAWRKRAVQVIVASAFVVVALDLFITKVWKPFSDTIPISVLVWSWLGISGLALATTLIVTRWRSWWTILTVVAGLVALIGVAGVQINRYYGQYPTLGTALGWTRPVLTDLSLMRTAQETLPAPEGGYLAEVWQPPADLPAEGTISQIHVEPVASDFQARPGYVYLPPAYTATTPRPLLPVLVLLAGQPGNADSWLVSGQLHRKLDAYAKAHHGLAPIVVMVDNLGSNFANPLCVDSSHGNVETYLKTDVPEWIRTHLQTAPDRASWAIGGLSNGGTCALQMAVRAPGVYGRFIDISGELEPVDDSKKETVEKYFGGDEGAYGAISPVEIMKTEQFTGTSGRIVVGKGDRTYYSQLEQVLAACKAAGMDMSWLELAGGHTWQVWAPAMQMSLDWLAARTRLVRE